MRTFLSKYREEIFWFPRYLVLFSLNKKLWGYRFGEVDQMSGDLGKSYGKAWPGKTDEKTSSRNKVCSDGFTTF